MLRDEELALPVRAWPIEAYEYEPAHGFFLRLAKENSAQSTTVFADSLGLNGKDIVPAQLLEFCLQLPFRAHEYLVAATPDVNKKRVTLNGVVFRRKTDWSLERPRVCSGCLAENVYYRNWWDLTIMAHCPLHDLPLVRAYEKAMLAWWYPEIGKTPDGGSLIGPLLPSIGCIQPTWDTYVLGRMGVVSPLRVAVLDNCEMIDVIEAIELLGKMAIAGWSKHAPRGFTNFSENRYRALCIGFETFMEGQDGISALIDRYMDSAQKLGKSKKGSHKNKAFGWMWAQVDPLPENSATTQIRTSITIVAHRRGINSRLGARGRNLGSNMPIALKPLAKQLGMSSTTLKEFAFASGIITKQARKGVYHSIAPEEVEAIKNALAGSVTPREACSLFGLSPKLFKQLYNANVVQPIGHAGTCGARFRRFEILSVLNSIKAMASVGAPYKETTISLNKYCQFMKRPVVEVINAILAGELPVGWDHDKIGLQGCQISWRLEVNCSP
jgi:hypothetical protein